MSKRPLISFVIPTYNRSSLIRKNLDSILRYKGLDIEVVVVNDCSPDKTEQEISSINDGRISYFRNPKNINAVLNIFRSITLARGEWVFTLSDEDLVTPDMVESIVALLESNKDSNVAVFLGNIRNNTGPYPYYIYHNGIEYIPYHYGNRIYSKGDEAISEIGFDHRYLSGILMKKDILDFDFLKSLKPEDGLMAPQTILYTMALRYGKGATVDLDFCIKSVKPSGKSMVSKIKNESYKHPKNRFKQFALYLDVVDSIMENDSYKIHVLAKLYGYYLDESTYGWNNLVTTNNRAYEFGVENASKVDLISAVNEFNNKVIEYLASHYESSLFKDKLFNALHEKKMQICQKRNMVS